MNGAADRTLLEVRGVRRAFGGVVAVDDVSMTVEQGEIVGLIGPNGAGKTTLFDSISGLQKIDTGSVSLAGERIDNRRIHRIARSGLARTMQAGGVFADLTVAENLQVAAHWTSIERRVVPARASEVLDLVGIPGRERDLARELSYGQQRLLEFGMALMGNPRLILLDEPVAGINPLLVEQIQRIITTLNKSGTTFMVVEHNVPFVAAISTRVVAMAGGRIIAEGTAEAVRADPDVLEHYLTGG